MCLRLRSLFALLVRLMHPVLRRWLSPPTLLLFLPLLLLPLLFLLRHLLRLRRLARRVFFWLREASFCARFPLLFVVLALCAVF
ncbi:Uncharacterised protein [Mycobacterium tuberculosis]|nr:Uncharacterised protein [Mycobacterium tuberculosis]